MILKRFACFVLILGFAAPSAVLPSEVDRKNVHDVQKAYWDSIDVLELNGEEFVLDSALRRKEGPMMVHQEFRIRYGSGGRMAFRRISKDVAGGLKGIYEFREDGKTHYGIISFADDPDSIDRVVIRNQTDKPGDYQGEMCPFLWAWIPCGKPVQTWLNEGAALAWERGAEGREKPVLIGEHRKRRVRIELDAEHDWLPGRVEVEGSHACEVRSFVRDGGHWFPSDIAFLYDESILPAGSTTRIGFKLNEVRLNQGLPAGAFGMPELQDGAVVSDERNWSGYFKGGFEARKRLERARGIGPVPKTANDPAQAASNVVAAAEDRRFPWEIGLAGLSIAALGLSWKLRRDS